MARTEAQSSALGQLDEASSGAIVELSKITVPYTTIVNRAQMVDLSRDLMPRFGIERIPTQQAMLLSSESGPNGELVYKPVNDRMDQIRFCGNINSYNNSSGQYVDGAAGSFAEITFYGTGLNYLTLIDNNARSMSLTVDGVASGTLIPTTTSTSGILNGRNYSQNTVINVISGLTLGLHTVKITWASGPSFYFQGIEILNTNTTIQLTPGSIWSKGRKLTQASLGTTSYNTGFANQYQNGLATSSPTTSKGGRVVLYKKSDGTTAKDVTWVDTSSLTLSSTSHANEEVIRTYYWREFGAGRSDDFSTYSSGNSTRTFTLDDGVSTLVASNMNNAPVVEYLSTDQISGAFIMLTFVGTGLDLVWRSDNNARQFDTVSIDGGASVGVLALATPNNFFSNVKIVSGLPYGTHTAKFAKTTAAFSPSIAQFIVYGPKAPTLPTNAVAGGDYNIMADYAQVSSLTGITDREKPSTGVLRKASAREFVYSGTWSASLDVASLNGFNINTATATSYLEYTFFGTGIEPRFFVQNSAFNYTISIDGSSNLSTFTTNLVQGSTGVTFTAATGVLTTASAANAIVSLKITGLTPGKHTIRVTYNSGNNLQFSEFDVITPIHSHKNNGAFVLQNTLSVGSQGINDSRGFGKQISKNRGAIAKSLGITANPTIAVSTYAPIPDMLVTAKSETGFVHVEMPLTWHQTVADSTAFFTLYVDGNAIEYEEQASASTSTTTAGINTFNWKIAVGVGVHTYVAQWRTNGSGTMTATGIKRRLMISDIADIA